MKLNEKMADALSRVVSVLESDQFLIGSMNLEAMLLVFTTRANWMGSGDHDVDVLESYLALRNGDPEKRFKPLLKSRQDANNFKAEVTGINDFLSETFPASEGYRYVLITYLPDTLQIGPYVANAHRGDVVRAITELVTRFQIEPRDKIDE